MCNCYFKYVISAFCSQKTFKSEYASIKKKKHCVLFAQNLVDMASIQI